MEFLQSRKMLIFENLTFCQRYSFFVTISVTVMYNVVHILRLRYDY